MPTNITDHLNKILTEKTIMQCPDCQNTLKVANLKGVKVFECLECKGKWFNRHELMLVEKKADKDLRWLSFDPFGEDAKRLSVVSQGRQCPQCLKPMQSLTYLQSKVIIDKCQYCKGVWLSHGELAKIIRYLEQVIDSKSSKELAKETFKEFVKIFTGSEGVVSEVKDFLAVLYMLELRITSEHPSLARVSQDIYLDTPFK
jgi:Zn-finger nucleic acid-binding protein